MYNNVCQCLHILSRNIDRPDYNLIISKNFWDAVQNSLIFLRHLTKFIFSFKFKMPRNKLIHWSFRFHCLPEWLIAFIAQARYSEQQTIVYLITTAQCFFIVHEIPKRLINFKFKDSFWDDCVRADLLAVNMSFI